MILETMCCLIPINLDYILYTPKAIYQHLFRHVYISCEEEFLYENNKR
jgi:hypothetical protein